MKRFLTNAYQQGWPQERVATEVCDLTAGVDAGALRIHEVQTSVYTCKRVPDIDLSRSVLSL